jgi:hypothetical protein
MGSPTKSLEKKNIIFKKGDEIRRLDGMCVLVITVPLSEYRETTECLKKL